MKGGEAIAWLRAYRASGPTLGPGPNAASSRTAVVMTFHPFEGSKARPTQDRRYREDSSYEPTGR